jgi:hypothetical protein
MVQARKGVGLQLGDPTIHEGREWVEATLERAPSVMFLGPAARGHTTLGGGPPRPLSAVEMVLKEIVIAERTGRTHRAATVFFVVRCTWDTMRSAAQWLRSALA